MDYNIGSFFILKKSKMVNTIETDKKDSEIVKTIINNKKPIYIFCLKKTDNNHYLCACVYDVITDNSILLSNGLNLNLWICYEKLVNINLAFFKNSGLRFNNVSTTISEVFSNNKKLDDLKRMSKEQNKKNKKNKRVRNNRKYSKISADEVKKDPRYYNNGEVVKLEKGIAPHYSKKANMWLNTNHPVSAGRGDF